MKSIITNHYSFHSIIILLIYVYHIKITIGTPVASPNWELLITPDGVIFSPRNGIYVSNIINICTIFNVMNTMCMSR